MHRQGAIALHDGAPGNLGLDYEYGDRGEHRAGLCQMPSTSFASNFTHSASPAIRWSRSRAPRSTTRPRNSTSLGADAGRDRHQGTLSRIIGLAAGEVPHPLDGCRRRVRRAQRNLSGISRGDAGREANRQAGEMARHAFGNDVRRSSRSRRRSDRRTGAR